MSRTFVVPDLHGRFDLMQRALERIEMGSPAGGTVVFLGDYIDRGPQSREVIERLLAGAPKRWTWIALKGNHEDMMVACNDGPDLSWWLGNGGTQTIESYGGSIPTHHIEWAKNLPMIHTDAHRVYVHAGVQPGRPLDAQGEAVLLWMRYPANASEIEYPGLHIVHGHTPVRGGPELYHGRTNLDTGAVFYDRLVVGVFDDDKPGGPISLIEITGHPS